MPSYGLERPDITYRADELFADLSVWDVFFREHVNLSAIEATGLEFDFSHFWRIPRPDDPDPFDGILGELDVPVKLTIGRAAVEGRAFLPGAEEDPLTISFTVEGGGVAVGETGRFAIDILVKDPAAEGWRRELRVGRDRLAPGRSRQI